MASTISLQTVVNFARTQARLLPLVSVGGFANEPALTLCNSVIQYMLMGGVDSDGEPVGPFPWKFNRKEATAFDTTENTQDYVATINDLSWLETAVIEDKNSTATPKPCGVIEVVRIMPKASEKGMPQKLCWLPKSDTEIYWRLNRPAGSTVYTVYPVYQMKPPQKTALTEFWSPVPDEYSYVYRQGFLAFAKRHAQMPDWVSEFKLFLAMIAGALGQADAEPQSQSFYPERPILLG